MIPSPILLRLMARSFYEVYDLVLDQIEAIDLLDSVYLAYTKSRLARDKNKKKKKKN